MIIIIYYYNNIKIIFLFFLVDQKYHKLIYHGDKSFSNLVKTETGNNLNVIIGHIITINYILIQLIFTNFYILF